MRVYVYMFAGVKDGCVNCVGRGVWCECHMQNIEISSTHICSKYTMSGQCNLVNVLCSKVKPVFYLTQWIVIWVTVTLFFFQLLLLPSPKFPTFETDQSRPKFCRKLLKSPKVRGNEMLWKWMKSKYYTIKFC